MIHQIKKGISGLVNRVLYWATGTGLAQKETAASGERYVTPGMPELARRAAAEGCVLLKNDGVLPLDPARTVAVFGRCQLDWFYVGYGSGGNVHPPYRVNLMDGLDRAGVPYDRPLAERYRKWCSSKEHAADHGWWGHWPMSHPEMPLDPEAVRRAAEACDTALVVIGRAAGEDRENTLEKGSYYLTDLEREMLDKVTARFRHTVVALNTGGMMDLSWTEEYGEKLSAVLIVWLGGMESGSAAADVLYGKISPSGRLADTAARRYEDYPSSRNFGGRTFNDYAEGIFVGYRYFDTFAPDKVLYPFGWGLSYTSFQITAESLRRDAGTVEAAVTVQNTGQRPGREVVQLWCAPPSGGLQKPARVLTAFAKTEELPPGGRTALVLSCTDRDLASYDELRQAFVLEAGEYRFTVNGAEAGSFTLPEARVVESCEAVCSPDVDLKERILSRLPEEIPATGDRGYRLSDVAEGRASLDAFIAQLGDDELEALSRGHGMMNSRLGTPGNAGTLGGVIPSLREKGVAPITTADGPSGLRLQRYCSLLPCGTALACTWDAGLVEDLYRLVGREMRHYGVDLLLAPGMNLHRDPLCGRNFEYFSEDPLLSGKMAAAVVRGVQSQGVGCCPKHFACNNQESRRNTHDSRVPVRALREIYLRNFEICVREARPLTLMSSYNKVNGVWAHYHYDLMTTVLRREWGFGGAVITDWWMQRSASPEFPALRDNAYRVRAQVDVLMPGDWTHLARRYRPDGSLLKTLGRPGGITRGELQRTARNVLTLVMGLKGGAPEEKTRED